MSIDNEKFLKYLNIVNDFLSFKINIFPIIGQVLYVISIVLSLIRGIQFISYNHPWLGLLVIVAGPILSHIVLEVCLLFFAMVDLLREIRNALVEKKQ